MLRHIKLFVGCLMLLMALMTIIEIAKIPKDGKDIGTEAFVKSFFESGTPRIRQRNKAQSLNVSKWIVITSIAYPTEAIKTLAAEEEWRIVVVGDEKTPSDWALPNCEFLSIEKQEQLGYAINDHVPFKSYTRKMIGYLYAIENGAEWIYDTDDDNQPIGKGLNQFDIKTDHVSGISYGEEVRQEQSFFGQQGMWPRGYPLENISEENKNNLYLLCKEQKTPAIQQGLVRKDPDVDAIYRLLHADKKDGLEVNFNVHAPPIILNKGVYCPFNSQNTLFRRDAFWALFLPTSVAFRVTDIWRSYFAQKLLHLTDNRLGFYPSNAVQKRNFHSYLADFNDETLFYSHAGRLIDFLTNWTCNGTSLPNCMLDLSEAFMREQFWNSSDLDLTTAWITDLKSLDYKFPAITSTNLDTEKNTQAKDCRKVSLTFSASKEKRITQARKGYSELKDWCSAANSSFDGYCFDGQNNLTNGVWGNLQKIALIVTSNFAFGPSISLMQRVYEGYFATVIFCGPVNFNRIYNKNDTIKVGGKRVTNDFLRVQPFSYINVSEKEITSGYRAYICPAKATEMRLQNINGYMVIADDTVYNFWNEFDTSRFRIAAMTKAKYGPWRRHSTGEAAMNKAILLIKNRTMNSSESTLSKELVKFSKMKGEDIYGILNELLWAIGDFYYVPQTCELLFYELSEVFFEARLFHEIAVPSLAAACGMDWRKLLIKDANNAQQRDIAADKYKHLWGHERESWMKFYSNELIYIHPLKLSTVSDIKKRKNYCSGPINSFVRALSSSNATVATYYTSISTTTSSSASKTAATTTTVAAFTLTSTTSVAKNISIHELRRGDFTGE